VQSLLLKYFPALTQEQLGQFGRLPELYEYWNARINVISRKDIGQLGERHVLHSLGIAKVISFKPGTRVLDVGTGGGFPGIPLAIMFPECEFLLADSIAKKIRVVNEVASALGLRNVTARQQRAEEIKEKLHFVVSRAVTEFPAFHSWVKGRFLPENFNDLPNGILALKGGDLQEEMGGMYWRAKIFDLSAFFEDEFFQTKKVVYYPA
jgi:16S rRNA (guanine527-N7)-methyltransferase